MKSENFQALTSELTQLTPHQRSILSDRLREIAHASVSRALIEERLSNKPLCPKCSKEHIVRWGSASKLQRYRCQD
jgi:transposase-like protein